MGKKNGEWLITDMNVLSIFFSLTAFANNVFNSFRIFA